MNTASDRYATESTTLATGEPPIRSRVAPDINPIGGGIVDDSQAADTSPGDGKTYAKQLSGEEIAQARAYAAEHHKPASPESKHPSIMDKVSGLGNVVVGKVSHNPGKVAYGKAKAHGEL
ncbi:unnamed protein product [Cutaneotrichosporon oleaginosum]